jgi:AhpD family alkylhydroperoxidase
MDARLNYYGSPIGSKVAKHLISAGKVVSDSTLPTATKHLVETRASQINGCAYCVDMHTKDADEAWANAAKHYHDDQLAALVCQIGLINTWNRLNVITQQPAGDYQPGQFG